MSSWDGRVSNLFKALLSLFLFALVAWVSFRIWSWNQAGGAVSATDVQALALVPVPELPAQAVALVQANASTNRSAVIAAVLQSVSVKTRPGLLPFMVSALVRNFPDQLEAILDDAIDLQPGLTLVFAQASILQQPGCGEQISYVLGKKTPWLAPDIVKTLAGVVNDEPAFERGLQRGIAEGARDNKSE